MARTPIITNDVPKLRFYLDKDMDEAATATAVRLVLGKLQGYPRDSAHAYTYMLVAVAFYRSGRPYKKPFRAMIESTQPDRRELLRRDFNNLRHKSPHQTHSLSLSIHELYSLTRRLFTRLSNVTH